MKNKPMILLGTIDNQKIYIYPYMKEDEILQGKNYWIVSKKVGGFLEVITIEYELLLH